MTHINRRQIMQLLIDCDIQTRRTEQIRQWQKFAEAVLLKFGKPKWQPIETEPKNIQDLLTLEDLCQWLRQNSSGVYRPSGEAATVIRALAAKADVPMTTSIFDSLLSQNETN